MWKYVFLREMLSRSDSRKCLTFPAFSAMATRAARPCMMINKAGYGNRALCIKLGPRAGLPVPNFTELPPTLSGTRKIGVYTFGVQRYNRRKKTRPHGRGGCLQRFPSDKSGSECVAIPDLSSPRFCLISLWRRHDGSLACYSLGHP